MTLTKEQKAAREGRLTASRIAVLMEGDMEKILDLWKELVGDPTWVAPDFSDNWPVNFGEATEDINLKWFSKKHGSISRVGEVVVHPTKPFAATLDAWSDAHNCPIECKTVGGFEKFETIIQRYQPQMQFQMYLAQATQCAFSVIEGGREPRVELINRDEPYIQTMLDRATLFMKAVENMERPVAILPAQAPVKPIRSYDFSTNNAWCHLAGVFMNTKSQAQEHERAKSELKDMVPADAQRITGGGIIVERDRASRIQIKADTSHGKT